MDPKDLIATILSILAIVISIITFHSQREFNKHSLRAVCKIDVFSKKGNIQIVFRNVGNGVMYVKKIHYKDSSTGQKIEVLSRWLKDIPCKTNCEETLDGTWVGKSMSYNLLYRVVASQKSLDNTWRKIRNLQITVEYEDTFGIKNTYQYSLETDYVIYSAAKGNRNLIASRNNRVHPV